MGKASRKKKTNLEHAAADSKHLKSSDIPVTSGVLNKQIIHFLLIILLALVTYSNVLHVPFQLDDKGNIVENPLIKNSRFLFSPQEYCSKVDPSSNERVICSFFKRRFVGYLTFAADYRLHGSNVTGYHILNLVIHILNALLVYSLVSIGFQTPSLNESSLKKHSSSIALFSALFFVSHPIQTQAVTYIVQRLASLAAMFYLLSLVSYIKSRLSVSPAKRYAFYAVSFISAVLAMKSKEISFTLPFAIALYEIMFFDGKTTKRFFYLLPMLLTIVILPMTFMGTNEQFGDSFRDTIEAARVQTTMSRWDYLLTQFRVIVTYLRLLFVPVGQNLDYDYQVYHSFFRPEVSLSFLVLAAIIGLGIYILYRYGSVASEAKLISFGIFWFFVTLSVESSIIPIKDVIFEHRVYLPSVGVFIAGMTSLFVVKGRLEQRNPPAGKAILPICGLMVIALSSVAYARNTVWQSEVALWSDVVEKSPYKARGHNNLGKAYYDEGLFDKAAEHFLLALQLDTLNSEAHVNMGNVYQKRGVWDKAMEQYQIAVKQKPYFPSAHYNLGITYYERGLWDKAIEQYQIALQQEPDYSEADNNLGNAYFSKGLLEKARESYESALKLKPDNAEAHNGLGSVYVSQGLWDKAIEQYQIALQLKPNFADAHGNLGIIYMRKGLMTEAQRELEIALKIRPNFTGAHQALETVTKRVTSLH